ncbi:DUF4124 domain-containing protein [Vreelandella zhaodongensis]|uniref:DUF4124 domain-containing protein n=1 Tax=Vreelandella zhaodongensis TaxID=1176240 RepID=A0ABX2SSQ2_VREZH|nr:DUF4124 domain-containing protein [Halomonas zhaodongensis]NYS45142.1 DUF4124 domain-containing protein [Halomonas zhaodongensis]
MKKTALLAFLFALPVTAHAELFKCVENGHTTFQDFPCANGNSETVDTNNLTIIAPPRVTTPSQPARSATPQLRQPAYSSSSSSYQTSTQRRNAEVRARARGVVIPGMSENQAISVLGNPTRISSYTYGGNLCRRLYWDGRQRFQSGRHTVIICNGEVSSYARR